MKILVIRCDKMDEECKAIARKCTDEELINHITNCKKCKNTQIWEPQHKQH